MHDSIRTRSVTAGRIGRLLLVAALAACGGEAGDGEAGSGGPADIRADGPVSQEARAGAENAQCDPPPAIDPAYFTASWDSLMTWLTTNNVTFAGDTAAATARVRLSRTSDPAQLTIQSESRAYCLKRSDLRGNPRIVGVYRVVDPTTAWNHRFGARDSVLVFATSDSAVLAYRDGGRVRTAPSTAWSFRFCPDNHQPTRPRGQWRDLQTGSPVGRQDGTRPDRPGEKGKGRDDEIDPGTYGWMACASGCCQFYIPPNPGDVGNPPGNPGRPPCPQPPA